MANTARQFVEEQQRGQDIRTHLAQKLRREDSRQQGDDEHHHEHRGEQPPQTTDEEVLEVDGTRTLELAYQPTGDEVARDDDEDRDTQEPGRQPSGMGMVDDDGEDGEGTDPVEGKYALPASRTADRCG